MAGTPISNLQLAGAVAPQGIEAALGAMGTALQQQQQYTNNQKLLDELTLARAVADEREMATRSALRQQAGTGYETSEKLSNEIFNRVQGRIDTLDSQSLIKAQEQADEAVSMGVIPAEQKPQYIQELTLEIKNSPEMQAQYEQAPNDALAEIGGTLRGGEVLRDLVLTGMMTPHEQKMKQIEAETRAAKALRSDLTGSSRFGEQLQKDYLNDIQTRMKVARDKLMSPELRDIILSQKTSGAKENFKEQAKDILSDVMKVQGMSRKVALDMGRTFRKSMIDAIPELEGELPEIKEVSASNVPTPKRMTNKEQELRHYLGVPPAPVSEQKMTPGLVKLQEQVKRLLLQAKKADKKVDPKKIRRFFTDPKYYLTPAEQNSIVEQLLKDVKPGISIPSQTIEM
jgi:hypothetical protein